MTKFTCKSPVDGSVYAERAVTTDADARTAFAAARRAQADWAALPIAKRADYCTAMVDAMLSMKDEIATELAWQMGRPISQGAGELGGFEERARHMIAIAEGALAPIDVGPKEGFTRAINRVPLGVVFVLAPWNFPYLTAVNSIIPALMAGNAVVLKHAEQTFLTGERFARAAEMAGLPDGLFANIAVTHDQTARLIRERLADQVNFTGSVGGGAAIETAAAGTFAGVGLELGGKDAAYVLADADLDFAIENLADGAFFNSGQSCCGIERIYVHADLHDAFVEGLAAFVQRSFTLDTPLEPATNLGPLVRTSAADFVRGQIDAAVSAGARACVDTSAFSRDAKGTPYMAPQVLSNVDHSMSVMTDESFGPVVGVMKVADDAEAIRLMNDSEFGLTGSLWSRDLARVEQLAPQVEAGTIFMNRCDYLDPALAWTGIRHSGRGTTLSRVGYEALTRPKSYHFRHAI